MKKGKFSLILSLSILMVGAVFVLLGVLSYLGVLVSPLSDFSEKMSLFLSITGGGDRLWETGAFLVFDALLILILRGRKPFSMFVVVYLWPMYFTLLSAVRKISGAPFPSYIPLSVTEANTGLLFVLFVLELLLAFVLLLSVQGLDEKWRKKRELNRRMLEKEGLIKTKESIEEEKLLNRERKLKAMEDKKRAKEEAKYEKERQKAEKAENLAKAKQAERDKIKYEKKREKEEERREKEEKRLEKKQLKEKDKALEESQIEKEKIDAKAEKIRKKQLSEDEKKRKALEEERKRIEEEEIGPAPEYASGIGNPNTPLVFPDFDPMPELRNIVKHNLGEEDDVPKLEEEKQERIIENSSFMDSLKEEMDRDEKEVKPKNRYSDTRFVSGGMLEATLESAALSNPVEYNTERRPIIGLDDKEEKKEETKTSSSFAPSTLSPDHPRYKYFENLQKSQSSVAEEEENEERVKNIAPSTLSPNHPRYKYFENLENGKVDDEVKSVDEEAKNIAPSTLSPNHPRYKYFEELSKKREESVEPKEEKTASRNDPSPSDLPPDHPRRKLFEALENNNGGSSVSYIPQRPFVPEIKEEEKTVEYSDFTPKTEKIPLSPLSSLDNDKAKILEKINASVREENMKNMKLEENKTVEENEETAFTPPENTRTRDVVENDDGTKTITVKTDEEEENDFNLCVGVGNLASNMLGYTAIEIRQKAKYTPPLPSLLKEYPGISQEIDD